MKLYFKYLLYILLLTPVPLIAQKRLVSVLAEPFDISLSLPPNSLLPDKGATYGPFEILDIQLIPANQKDNLVQLQLVAYDTGLFRLSEIMPALTADTAYWVKIVSPAENEIKEYGQPKEITIPEEIEQNNLPLWLILTLSAMVAVLLLYLLKKKKKDEKITEPPTSEHSMDILLALETKWGKQEINSVQLGEKLVHALHIHFGVSTKKSIAALYKVINKQVHEFNKQEIKQYLRLSDAWRYGKQHADKATGEQAIEAVKKIMILTAAGQKKQTHV